MVRANSAKLGTANAPTPSTRIFPRMYTSISAIQVKPDEVTVRLGGAVGFARRMVFTRVLAFWMAQDSFRGRRLGEFSCVATRGPRDAYMR